MGIEVYLIVLILALLAIPTFFFWRWVLKKYLSHNKKRQTATWLLTLITTPVIYCGSIVLIFFLPPIESHKDFDKTEWSSNLETRYEMGNNIVKSKMLINKDSNQVKQILGTPTWRDSTAHEWTYDMGYGSATDPWSIRYHELVLKIVRNNVVSVANTKHDVK